MAFVRKKVIGGRPYFYLVENKRINGKVVQRVLKYVGTKKPKKKS
jgi:hypothetical protein